MGPTSIGKLRASARVGCPWPVAVFATAVLAQAELGATLGTSRGTRSSGRTIAVSGDGGTVCVGTVHGLDGRYMIWRDGQSVGACADLDRPGIRGGCVAAFGDRYLFISVIHSNETGDLKGELHPPKGLAWYSISRRTLTGDHAPFAGGLGPFRDQLVLHEAPVTMNAEARGMACDSNGRLIVSDPAAASIRIYDQETMRETGRITALRAREVAVAPDGSLWALHAPDASAPSSDRLKPDREDTQWRVVRHSADGRERLTLWLPKSSVPTGLTFDSRGRLMVADAGQARGILVFADPRKGGARPRTIRWPDRSLSVAGIGCDGVGYLYAVAYRPGGGTVIRCYEPPEPGRRLRLRWEKALSDSSDSSDSSDPSDASDKSDSSFLSVLLNRR